MARTNVPRFFNAWSHLASLAFCQFACRVSLREASARLRPALPQPLRPSLGLVTGEQVGDGFGERGSGGILSAACFFDERKHNVFGQKWWSRKATQKRPMLDACDMTPWNVIKNVIPTDFWRRDERARKKINIKLKKAFAQNKITQGWAIDT